MEQLNQSKLQNCQKIQWETMSEIDKWVLGKAKIALNIFIPTCIVSIGTVIAAINSLLTHNPIAETYFNITAPIVIVVGSCIMLFLKYIKKTEDDYYEDEWNKYLIRKAKAEHRI